MNTAKPVLTLEALGRRLPAAPVGNLFGQALSLPEGEQLSFFVPDLSQWASFATSLLKFEFPPVHLFATLRRFSAQWLANPRASKRHLQKLPWPALEWLMQQLCLETLQTQLTPDDISVQLWLVAQELSEFSIQSLVQADVHLLGQEDPSRLHSYYYQGAQDMETLWRILSAHGFESPAAQASADWVKQDFSLTPLLNSAKNNSASWAYWLVRRLAHPFPWASLIQALKQEPETWARLIESSPLLNSIENRLLAAPAGQRIHSLKPTLQDVSNILQILLNEKKQNNVIPQKNWIPKITAERETLWTKRPYQRLILVEGTTEAILLPLFIRLYHRMRFEQIETSTAKPDLATQQNSLSLLEKIRHTPVIAVGGKNQMVAQYRQLASELQIPMSVLLDADAVSTEQQLKTVLRETDTVLVIPDGEIEDLYDRDVLMATVNQVYQPHPGLTASFYRNLVSLSDPLTIDLKGIQAPKGRVAELRLIWQVLNLGKFDKVVLAEHLAELLANHLVHGTSIPLEMRPEQHPKQVHIPTEWHWNQLLPPKIAHMLLTLYGIEERQKTEIR